MKRLVAFIISVALTATLSAAPSYRSSVRPLVYVHDGGKAPICTVVQVEDWPGYWVGAGHCVKNAVWVQLAPGIHQFKVAYPTIDGHRAIITFVNTDWTDVAVFYTPGYDIPGIELYSGRLKKGDVVLTPSYREAKEFVQSPGVIVDIPFEASFSYEDGLKNRVGFAIDHGDLPIEQRPTFGSSGAPVLKDGRIAGIHIGSGVRVDGTEQSFALPIEQLFKAMKGQR